MSNRQTRAILAPLLLTGVLMAAYLLLRPYGDAAGHTPAEQAQAFASGLWVVAHVCGVLALAAYAMVAHRVTQGDESRSAWVARSASVLGAFLVGPYYGAETFGLHVVGTHAAAGRPELLSLVAEIRDNGVALSLFAAGLVALAVSGVALGLSWHADRWAAWPFATLVALFTPQYFLPPTGRIAYGVLYLAASLVLAWAIARPTTSTGKAYAALPQT